MLRDISTIPQNTITMSRPIPQIDHDWANYFDTNAALESVAAHIAALRSTKRTPEKHTLRSYQAGLSYFLNWSLDQLPSKALLEKYIAHLSTKTNHRTKGYGLSSSTISSKYLAPLRLYLNALVDQHIPGTQHDFHIIENYRNQIRAALKIKSPAGDETSDLSDLYRYGSRLSRRQVRKILKGLKQATNLASLRDHALLRTAFTTGLRLAELQRITLSNITEDETDPGKWKLVIRRKRCKYDPIAMPHEVMDAINDYVDKYNAGLPAGDPRRINDDTPIWQSLTRSGNYLPINHKTAVNHVGENIFYQPSKGMSTGGITGIIKKHANIAPHDCRRTTATIADQSSMPLSYISRLLGHASNATTERYIKRPPNTQFTDLTKYVTF